MRDRLRILPVSVASVHQFDAIAHFRHRRIRSSSHPDGRTDRVLCPTVDRQTRRSHPWPAPLNSMQKHPLLVSALSRFRDYIAEARQRNAPDAHAASLATVGANARPSVRTVHVMEVSDEALFIATRTDSGKAAQMNQNPAVSICMVWPCLHRQMTLEGNAQRSDEHLADKLWSKRPREDQLAAWASESCQALANTTFRDALTAARRQFDFSPVPRPENWGGFRIDPIQICDWPTGWHRGRQRIRIKLDNSGNWVADELSA